VPARERGPVITESGSLAIDAQARLPAAESWQREIERPAAAAKAADVRGSVGLLHGGCSVNDMDDADKRRGAVGDRRRSAQDLDALDIAQVQRRQRRVEGAAPRDVIDHQQERVELAQAPEFGNRAGWTDIRALSDDDSCREAKCL